jgi:hypothetical protein
VNTDLWPEISIATKPRGMKQILREAGKGLAEKTGNLINFDVRARANPVGEQFTFECLLFAPSITYRYPIVRVTTGVTAFPADVVADGGIERKGIQNEAELKQVLADIFQSDRTKQLLNNLLAVAGD